MKCVAVLAAVVSYAYAESVFVGCYFDDSADPEFIAETKVLPDGMSLKFCETHCGVMASGPYKYFGLKAGTECWCGDSYGKHGNSNNCDKTCHNGATPDNKGKCGGARELAVYSTTASATDTREGVVKADQVSWTAIGCFKDKSPGRAFDKDSLFEDSSMTYMMCAEHCQKQAKPYMALQDSNQCFCGSDVGKTYGESTKCTKPCAGDEAAMCGGPFANQVFKLTEKAAATSVVVEAGAVAPAQPVIKCGVPESVIVATVVVIATGMGNYAFCTASVLCSIHPRATTSIFIGALAAQFFIAGVSALLGHILPDSNLFVPVIYKVFAAIACTLAGLVQVHKSYSVAGREQEDRREEYLMAYIDCEEKQTVWRYWGCVNRRQILLSLHLTRVPGGENTRCPTVPKIHYHIRKYL